MSLVAAAMEARAAEQMDLLAAAPSARRVVCACGCGRWTWIPHRKGRLPLYLTPDCYLRERRRSRPRREHMTFTVGDAVAWESQSAGRYTRKEGTIEEIVPAGVRPVGRSKFQAPGAARDHESYLVRVKGRGLYWPRVSSLKAVAP